MNLDELRSVQSKERQTDSLQHLRESFYADVSEYVSELEDERDRVAADADDPFADPEVRQLTDEIETAREVVEAIYDRRLGKLVKRATLAAADMPADEEGLTAEERDLFDDLVERIEENKAHVLDVLDADPDEATAGAGADERTTAPTVDAAATSDEDTTVAPDEAPEAAPPGRSARDVDPDTEHVAGSEPAGEDAGTAPDDSPADVRDGTGTTTQHGSAASEDPPAAAGPDQAGPGTRTTVRITGDVDQFYGVDDREYDLDPETVVTLPAANAEPLLQSGDAEQVD